MAWLAGAAWLRETEQGTQGTAQVTTSTRDDTFLTCLRYPGIADK